MEELVELFKLMKEAKEEPSERCKDDKHHTFEFLTHTDGRKSCSYYHQCSKCNEVIVDKVDRKGEDKLLWG